MSPDDVIAKIADRTIYYREIRCDRVWIQQMLRARNESRPADDACRDMEQARLDLILTTELIERASATAGLEISPAEITAQELPILHDEAELARYVEFSLALPTAIARVRKGEDADVVYAQALEPRGIPRETFDSVSRVFDTKEKIERYLSQDARERTVSSLRRNARLAAIGARLLADHRQRAEETRRPVADVTAEFWKHVIAHTQTTVVADGYRLPDLKELP
jgi:hypothetical protein